MPQLSHDEAQESPGSLALPLMTMTSLTGPEAASGFKPPRGVEWEVRE